MIQILYFASLREALTTDSEKLAYRPGLTAALVMQELAERGEPWSTAFASDQQILIAINQEMAKAETFLKDGDELAFFPPVTGG